MVNPFFKNNGPFKLSEILKDLNVKFDIINEDLNITNIQDLQNSQSNELTFFHSKKYKSIANTTKASFCITTENLKDELPKSCKTIIVDNVLVSTSIILSLIHI